MSMRPTFLVIGAAKSGSSSLCYLLSQHPDVFVTSTKELHFFSYAEVYALGTDWYESQFARARAAQQRGEGSQSYTVRKLFPNTAARIHAYAPDVKLIYIVRHPLERIESLWIQLRCKDPRFPGGLLDIREASLVDPSFNVAVRKQADALVDSSNYWDEINEYRKYFDDRQILVVFFDDFKREQAAVLKRCFEFLGVDATKEIQVDTAHLNASSDHQEPGRLMSLLKATPTRARIYRAAAGLVPHGLRAWVSARWLRTPMEQKPQWETSEREWVVRRLEANTARFLEVYDRPADFWKF